MSELQKALLSLLEPALHSFYRILRELAISYYHLVKLVSEEIRTLGPTMTIIDRKKTAPRPEVNLLELWLDDIQDYGDSIFIVAAHHALVSISCISDHNSILLRGKLSWVVILAELDDLFLLHLHVLLSLAQRHPHPTIFHDIVRPQISLLLALLFLFQSLQHSVVGLFLFLNQLFFLFFFSIFILLQALLERIERIDQRRSFIFYHIL